MDTMFEKLITDAGVPTAASEFLRAQGIVNADKFGILASEEKEVKVEIIDMMLAGGVKLERLDDKASIKLLWRSCRKTISGGSPPDDGVSGDSAIPKAPKEDLDALWLRSHGFTIPDAWMLAPSLQLKIWRSFNDEEPVVVPLLAESLRLKTVTGRAAGTQISVVPGRPVETQAVVADLVKFPVDLYTRMRGWFTTMAFVSIKRTDWFDFQTAIFGSDKIIQFVSQTFDGNYAPMSHYANAWAGTVNYFADRVRVSKATLKDAVLNTGAWEHKWTNYTPGPNGGGKSGAPDLPQHVLDELSALRQSVKQWQSTADRNRIDADRARTASTNGGKGAKGGYGKWHDGGGKGNGHRDKPKSSRDNDGGHEKERRRSRDRR